MAEKNIYLAVERYDGSRACAKVYQDDAGVWWYPTARGRIRAAGHSCSCGRQFFTRANRPPPNGRCWSCNRSDGFRIRRPAGTRRENQHGYIEIKLASDDPLRSMARPRYGWALEHRMVLARAIGRPLRGGETVHHINGRKTDNRLENLQLWSGNHGHGAVARCADCGSQHIEYIGISNRQEPLL